MEPLLRDMMMMMRTDLVDPMKTGRRRCHRVLAAAQQRGRYTWQITLVLIYFGQALYPQGLGDSQESGQSILIDAHFTTIHEIQEATHVHIWNILENDYRVLVRVSNEQGLKVGATRRQHHLMCPE